MFKFGNIKIGKKFIVAAEPPLGPAPVFIKLSEISAIRICDGEIVAIGPEQTCWIVLL